MDFTIPILQNLIQFFFVCKAIISKAKYLNTSMTSRFILANASRKDDKRRMDVMMRRWWRNEYYFNGNDSSSNLGIRISDIKNHFIIVTTDLNHIYTASTIVSTTTTVISPIAEAAAKASWNKPDINDHLSADERKDYQIQWKNVNG
ncbi:unnamed protein product [Rhizophagus irregularis]|nr:unnamed protein product [Rhizophagus irregularis]